MVPYDSIWSCMVFDILSYPIALLSPARYQMLADIESFALLLGFMPIRLATYKVNCLLLRCLLLNKLVTSLVS